MKVVIDENVPRVANEAARRDRGEAAGTPQADERCILAVVRRLREIVKRDQIVIDDAGVVLRAYRGALSGSGQPGAGDAFFKFILDRLYDRRKVIQRHLRLREDNSFADFPDTEQLRSFDHDDRCYVALAQAERGARILNAVDSDYKAHLSSLEQVGVQVEELCSHCLKNVT